VQRVRKLKESPSPPQEEEEGIWNEEKVEEEEDRDAWTNMNRVFEAELGPADVGTES
jgi:hypothetical protein